LMQIIILVAILHQARTALRVSGRGRSRGMVDEVLSEAKRRGECAR